MNDFEGALMLMKLREAVAFALQTPELLENPQGAANLYAMLPAPVRSNQAIASPETQRELS